MLQRLAQIAVRYARRLWQSPEAADTTTLGASGSRGVQDRARFWRELREGQREAEARKIALMGKP